MKRSVGVRGLIAALLGVVHAFSFSGEWMGWLQALAMAAWCALFFEALEERGQSTTRRTRCRHAALLGLSFGLGWFIAGVAWLFISMHRYGGMPAPLAALALALFGAYLSIFPAAASALTCVLRARPSRPAGCSDALTLAASWGAFELLRGHLFTGFPWLSPGYAHVDGPLAGLAPLLGAYGVGCLAILCSAALALFIRHAWRTRLVNAPALALLLLPPALGLLSGLVRWGEPTSETLRVRLLQGNVEQELKFDSARSLSAMRAYIEAVEPGRAALTVMPETAWTVGWDQTPESLVRVLRSNLAPGERVAIGMPLIETAPGGRYTNSIAVVDSSGNIVSRYDKRHLVPFGEFIPSGFQWFVALMQIPLGEFGRGRDDQALLQIGAHRIAFNICYEDLFGEELAAQVRAGADVLINASNIGWFGDSHALGQHLQIARMRSIELARPMLRATNTGVTAAIDHRGNVLGRLPAHQVGSLLAEVRPITELTPFARWGNWPAVWLILVLLASARGVARMGSVTASDRPR